MTPNYTFVSKSTAKPGRFDDLLRIVQDPPQTITKNLDGPVLYQVGQDRDRNTVIIWVTMTDKQAMYDYLASPLGQANHGSAEEMDAIIESFEMFDLTPTVQNVEFTGQIS